MGHSRESKADSHERIVAIASQRIRQQGTVSPGVAEIMNAAGLTHGGFYKHFSSREELICEAAERAFSDGREAMSAVTDEAEEPLRAFVDWYLSEAHRENCAKGCGVAALGGDVLRGEQALRSAYRKQVEDYVERLTSMLGEGAGARRQALVTVSALVGAMTVARGVGDRALSAEILADVREAINDGRVG